MCGVFAWNVTPDWKHKWIFISIASIFVGCADNFHLNNIFIVYHSSWAQLLILTLTLLFERNYENESVEKERKKN